MVSELDDAYENLGLALRNAPDHREWGAVAFLANLRGILVGLPGSKFHRTPPKGGTDADLTPRQVRDLIARANQETRRLHERYGTPMISG